MPICPADLKAYATNSAVDTSDETQLRSSISRAYYSAYHTLLPFAEQLPKSSSCPSVMHHMTHKELYERFSEWRTAGVHPALGPLTITKGQICRALDAARMSRVKADYRLEVGINIGHAKTQLERIRQIERAMLQIDNAMKPSVSANDAADGDAA